MEQGGGNNTNTEINWINNLFPNQQNNNIASVTATGVGTHGYQWPYGALQSINNITRSNISSLTNNGSTNGNVSYTQPVASAVPFHTNFALAPKNEKRSLSKDNIPREDLHVISFHPPGFPRAFDVPFPDKRLAVCERCKRNFKSRELCRTRDGHTALPWTTSYAVFTVDESCIVTGPDGELLYADIPMVGERCDEPLMCLGPADGSMKSEPICQVCRNKNYTKDHCRNTCEHTAPPWSCTYIKVTADRSGNGSHARRKESSKRPYAKKKQKKETTGVQDYGDQDNPPSEINIGVSSASPHECVESDDEAEERHSDDLANIHPSRTFFADISSKHVYVRWCKRIKYPEMTENVPTQAVMQPGLNSNAEMESYFMQQMLAANMLQGSQGQQGGMAQAQGRTINGNSNGNAIASSSNMNANPLAPGGNSGDLNRFINFNMQQNNLLWEAFRAGAMWAQAQSAQLSGQGLVGTRNQVLSNNPSAFLAQQLQGSGGQSNANLGGGGGQDQNGSNGIRGGDVFGGLQGSFNPTL